MTYSSLIQSDAGKALRAFKEHADAGVRKQAKAVISHWKTSLVVRGEGREEKGERGVVRGEGGGEEGESGKGPRSIVD